MGPCARVPVRAGGGGSMLVISVGVSGCVGRCGNTWGTGLADHGVTVCEVLMESPWLIGMLLMGCFSL